MGIRFGLGRSNTFINEYFFSKGLYTLTPRSRLRMIPGTSVFLAAAIGGVAAGISIPCSIIAGITGIRSFTCSLAADRFSRAGMGSGFCTPPVRNGIGSSIRSSIDDYRHGAVTSCTRAARYTPSAFARTFRHPSCSRTDGSRRAFRSIRGRRLRIFYICIQFFVFI